MRMKLALNKRALKGLSGILGNPHVPFLGGDIAAMLCLYPTSQFGGVLALTPGNSRRTEKPFLLQPVEKIWSVAGKFQRYARENGLGTERRALHLAGRSAAAETADSLKPEFWRRCHNL